MPFTHSEEPGSPVNTQLVLPKLDIADARLIAAHRATLVPEAYPPHSQLRLLAKIDDLVIADRQKDESMALLLHELRSPLGSIQNALAVLRKRGEDDPLQQPMHELIERQVRRMALLTAGLCQMSGPRLDNLQLPRQRIDLCDVLRRAAETVAPELISQSHELLVVLPQSSVWVLGDANLLEQVFINLLSNASKYSDVGGKIVLSMLLCDGDAVVQVRDFGIGIAADSIPFIFDLFVRADTAMVRTRSGLGIGWRW